MDTLHVVERETEIKAKDSSFALNLGEIWRYRDLLIMFVRRDFISVYKQTILGPLWFFIQPLLTTITFTFIFGNIANLSPDNTDTPKALFYLAGITIWSYFSDCLQQTSETFIKNSSIFGKVFFPRIIVPLSTIISNLFKFGIQILLFIIMFMVYYLNGKKLTPQYNYLLLLPVLIAIMAGLGLGFGMLISALTTKYRDLRFLITFGIQLWMYATPIIFALDKIPPKYAHLLWVIKANPMTSVVETFKYACLGLGVFSWGGLIYSFVFMIVTLMLGIFIFNRVEKNFMDIV